MLDLSKCKTFLVLFFICNFSTLKKLHLLTFKGAQTLLYDKFLTQTHPPLGPVPPLAVSTPRAPLPFPRSRILDQRGEAYSREGSEGRRLGRKASQPPASTPCQQCTVGHDLDKNPGKSRCPNSFGRWGIWSVLRGTIMNLSLAPFGASSAL